MDQQQAPEGMRSASDAAYRALALFAVVGLAMGADRTDITAWLAEEDLWLHLAPSEAAFIETPAPSRQQVIDAGWLSERLIVIVWALGGANALPPHDEQCDTALFQAVLPPFAATSVTAFVAAARLRPAAELLAMADEILMHHWDARDAAINDRAPTRRVDLGIVRERHHAINWLIGYDGLDWDDVTTDT